MGPSASSWLLGGRMKLGDVMHLARAVDYLDAEPDGADHWLFDDHGSTWRVPTAHLVELGAHVADRRVDADLYRVWWQRCQPTWTSD